MTKFHEHASKFKQHLLRTIKNIQTEQKQTYNKIRLTATVQAIYQTKITEYIFIPEVPSVKLAC